MQFVDEFRDPELAKKLVQRITERVRTLPSHCKLPLQLMEVCGGHTHAIFKFGLDQLLPPEIEFVHGPGCPVCVLPMGRIDECVEIASQPDVIFCTFGDAMRVPMRLDSLSAIAGNHPDAGRQARSRAGCGPGRQAQERIRR